MFMFVFLLILMPQMTKPALFLFASFKKYCFCSVDDRSDHVTPRRQASLFTDTAWDRPNDVSVSVCLSAEEARVAAHQPRPSGTCGRLPHQKAIKKQNKTKNT